jgi:hypothetical protein
MGKDNSSTQTPLLLVTATIQPKEPTDPEEGEHLFSFIDVGEGDPTAFYC